MLPAPMGLTHSVSQPDKIRSWYPYSIALLRSDKAIHEYAGLMWYKFLASRADAVEQELEARMGRRLRCDPLLVIAQALPLEALVDALELTLKS